MRDVINLGITIDRDHKMRRAAAHTHFDNNQTFTRLAVSSTNLQVSVLLQRAGIISLCVILPWPRYRAQHDNTEERIFNGSPGPLNLCHGAKWSQERRERKIADASVCDGCQQRSQEEAQSKSW